MRKQNQTVPLTDMPAAADMPAAEHNQTHPCEGADGDALQSTATPLCIRQGSKSSLNTTAV